MLTHLDIKNYILVDSLSLEFHSGMTVITGETGAGKSILVGALSLVLGGRAEIRVVRKDCESATITAIFNLDHLTCVKEWLKANDFEQQDECLLRRIITTQGRSRCYINDKPCTLNALETLGEMLVHIHGQHDQQKLLNRDYQRKLSDEYACEPNLLAEVKSGYQTWQNLEKQKIALTEQVKDFHSKHDYLLFQIQELEKLNLQPNELAQLHHEQKQLSHADEMIELAKYAHSALENMNEESFPEMTRAIEKLSALTSNTNLLNMLQTARVNLEELQRELAQSLEQIELDPARLMQIERRLEKIYDLARKHHVDPLELTHHQEKLQQQLKAMQEAFGQSEHMDHKIQKAYKHYLTYAQQLSSLRQENAAKLSSAITENLKKLAMKEAVCNINVKSDAQQFLSEHGIDRVEFLFQANPGVNQEPLAKIASGGELSRISLAIEAITAKTTVTPTLIFDEVDVGISGSVAEHVGRMLRLLSKEAQVICITHLAQVAACGQTHLCVTKSQGSNVTVTEIKLLTKEEKIQEIARMSAGIKITKSTLQHAREMLEQG